MNKETIGKRAAYLAPQIEVIEVENEGIMALSSTKPPTVNPGGGIFQGSGAARSGTRYQSQSTLNDLEDIINDFLTY